MTIVVVLRCGDGDLGATEGKARFSAVLDKAETEGPQLVRRRRQEFYVLTKEQLAARRGVLPEEKKPFVNAWDALRPPAEGLVNYNLPRLKWTPRKVKF